MKNIVLAQDIMGPREASKCHLASCLTHTSSFCPVDLLHPTGGSNPNPCNPPCPLPDKDDDSNSGNVLVQDLPGGLD